MEAACNRLARDHAVLERACDVNFVSRSFFWAWAAIRLKRAEGHRDRLRTILVLTTGDTEGCGAWRGWRMYSLFLLGAC